VYVHVLKYSNHATQTWLLFARYSVSENLSFTDQNKMTSVHDTADSRHHHAVLTLRRRTCTFYR